MNYSNFGRLLMLLLVFMIAFNFLFKYKKNDIEQFEDATGENYDVYKTIISTFNAILARNPNTTELFKYYKQMNSSEISTDKLKTILQNSDEYKRTEAIQNNLTSNKLVDSVNEQQVNSEIINLYTEIFNKSPNDIDINYFRQKYIELNLNKDDLTKYMLATPDYLKYADIVNEAEKELKASAAKGLSTGRSSAYGLTHIDKAAFPNVDIKDRVEVTDGKTTYIIERPNIFNFYNKDGENEQDLIDKSSRLIHTKIKDKPDSITETNIDEIQGIGSTTTAEANKNATACALLRNKSKTNYVQNRNLDELKYKCNTASRYTNADSFGKLIPTMEWSVPQERPPVCVGANYTANPLIDQSSLLGTLLEDSRDTSVGSILPRFTYTEEHTNKIINKV